MIVAIDPGSVVGCGVALFEERFGRAQLTRAYFVPSKGDPVATARAVRLTLPAEGLRLLVVERPQIYTRGTSKGDPNGLIELALLVGALLATIPHGLYRAPLPHEWKGNLPKDICHARALSKLDAAERDAIEPQRSVRKRGDVHDAVALGLWAIACRLA